jgi:phosphoesterase RecJ-like protein
MYQVNMLTKIIDQRLVDQVSTRVRQAERIVIVAHVSPDGDAIGSSLGLQHFLRTQQKRVAVVVPNAFPDFLKWMPGAKDVMCYHRYKEVADRLIAQADLIFCLDFNVISRIDTVAAAVEKSPAKRILVDHHLHPDAFCDTTISHPEISSTSELVFRLIWQLGHYQDISREAAECIYTGMMTDTGGFTYNSNQPEIYLIIAQLLQKGIDKDEIYRRTFNTNSEGRLRMMGYVLYEKMQVYPEFHTALICLSREEQSRFQCMKGDTEGFVNMPLQMKGISFSVFFREDTEKDMIKVSLRSVGSFPCNQVASEFFGGGGHLNASGGEHYGTMDEAVEIFKKAILKFEDQLQGRK